MELRQMDVMGGVKLADGRGLKISTGLDDHSRFCVCATLVPRATARPVCEALLTAMASHGIPEQLLADNPKVFTSRFNARRGEVLFDRLCRAQGIRHLLTAPHSPTTSGKVESLPQDDPPRLPGRMTRHWRDQNALSRRQHRSEPVCAASRPRGRRRGCPVTRPGLFSRAAADRVAANRLLTAGPSVSITKRHRYLRSAC
jgi:hypothetical protein